GRDAAELPIPDRTQAGGSDNGVARNIVDLECTAIEVAQYQVGCTGYVDRIDAGVLPLQTDSPTQNRWLWKRHARVPFGRQAVIFSSVKLCGESFRKRG